MTHSVLVWAGAVWGEHTLVAVALGTVILLQQENTAACPSPATECV